MTFSHSGFEKRALLDEAAQRAVKSHNQPTQFLDPETRKMKDKEHTGIELTGVELAYLRKMTSDRVRAIENNISTLERSLSERTAPNPSNTEEDLRSLREELNFLQYNLVERLFAEKEKGDADKSAPI